MKGTLDIHKQAEIIRAISVWSYCKISYKCNIHIKISKKQLANEGNEALLLSLDILSGFW